jgi:bifunctional non-homologous end joining protein LigD
VISHPDKVLFPESGITKGDLCAYYERVAAVMVPHIARRPVTMERYPAGIAKKGFIQKDVSKGFPEWLERVEVERQDEKRGGVVHYPLANDARALLWMANQNSITPHVWTSRTPELLQPDLCIFDLDPSREDPTTLRQAALAVRALLDEFALPSFVKTSGSKGFHIVVPLAAGTDFGQKFDDVWRFAHGAGALLVKRHPDLLTQEFIKADRGERIFVDTGRNGPGATCAAVYAVRPKEGAPVSAPCTWAEVESGAVGPQTFTIATLPQRLAERGDLWAPMPQQGVSLKSALAAVEAALTEDDWKESMAATTRRPTSRKKKPRP